MFSGYITEVGVVADAGRGLLVEAPKTAGTLHTGGSVSVNGACLSAVEVGDSSFRVEVSPETLNRSVMGPDGHMLSGPAVERFALKWGIPMISIDELAAHAR